MAAGALCHGTNGTMVNPALCVCRPMYVCVCVCVGGCVDACVCTDVRIYVRAYALTVSHTHLLDEAYVSKPNG